MARKPRSPKTSRTKTARTAAHFDALTDATLAEAAAVGWSTMTLADVAARAGLSLGELLVEAPSKAHLLAHLMSQVDRATFGTVEAPDLTQSARDRLFDVMMRRFDVLNRNRDGVRAVLRGLRCDPGAALMAWVRMDRSGAALLAAAGLSADGLGGFARIQGLKAIYLAALRAWARDDTDDMANTMAALDRALRQAEQLMRFMPVRPREASSTAASEA